MPAETAAVWVPTECHKIPDTQTSGDRPTLREQCDLSGKRFRCERESIDGVGRFRDAAQVHDPSPSGLQPCNGPQQRRFAGAVWADQCRHSSGGELKGCGVHNVVTVVSHGDLARMQINHGIRLAYPLPATTRSESFRYFSGRYAPSAVPSHLGTHTPAAGTA